MEIAVVIRFAIMLSVFVQVFGHRGNPSEQGGRNQGDTGSEHDSQNGGSCNNKNHRHGQGNGRNEPNEQEGSNGAGNDQNRSSWRKDFSEGNRRQGEGANQGGRQGVYDANGQGSAKHGSHSHERPKHNF